MTKDGNGDRRSIGSAVVLFAFLTIGFTASCRRSEQDQPVLPPDQLANAIENVRVEKKVVPSPPKRLAFLLLADLARVGAGVRCTLSQNGRTLLVAGGARALARVDGHPLFLDAAGAIDASAAFFKAPGVTISIGRHDVVAPQADAPGIAWPVGVTVGGMLNVEDEKIDARWSCGQKPR
jgi:hypothetical protein